MNIDKKALKSIVDEIEASRARQKGETEHQREVMKRAKAHQLDVKAIRIVLQRRAMGESKREEQDYYVHSYELALGGKKAAQEALEQGASVREAAKAGGISTGAAGNLAKAVQKSSFVDTETIAWAEKVAVELPREPQSTRPLKDFIAERRAASKITDTTVSTTGDAQGEDDGHSDGRPHSTLRGGDQHGARCGNSEDDRDGISGGAARREPRPSSEHAGDPGGPSGALSREEDGRGLGPTGCDLHAAAEPAVTAPPTESLGAVARQGDDGEEAEASTPASGPGTDGIGCERLDLNQRPQGYEPCELPSCSTPRESSSTEQPPTKSETGAVARPSSAERVASSINPDEDDLKIPLFLTKAGQRASAPSKEK